MQKYFRYQSAPDIYGISRNVGSSLNYARQLVPKEGGRHLFGNSFNQVQHACFGFFGGPSQREENKKYTPCLPFCMKTTASIFLLLETYLRKQTSMLCCIEIPHKASIPLNYVKAKFTSQNVYQYTHIWSPQSAFKISLLK